eukprot:CFRG0218T1
MFGNGMNDPEDPVNPRHGKKPSERTFCHENDHYTYEEQTCDQINKDFFDIVSEYDELMTNLSPLSLLERFAQVIDDKIAHQQTMGVHTLPSSSLELATLRDLKTERTTWALIHQLLSDRSRSDDMEVGVDNKNIFYSDYHVYEQLWHTDTVFREMHVVLQCLQKTYNEDYKRENYEINNSNPYTRNQAKSITTLYSKNTYYEHSKRNLEATVLGDGCDKLLDMDSKLRCPQGSLVVSSDTEFEHEMMREVFRLIRAGDIEHAKEVCYNCGHSWMSGVLEGAMESSGSSNSYITCYHNTDLIDRQRDEQEFNIQRTKRGELVGNVDRELWRETCLDVSRQSGEDRYARSIFGILGGDIGEAESAPGASMGISGIPQWLVSCETYEDAFWGLTRIFHDNILSHEIRVQESVLDTQRMPHRENYAGKHTSHTPSQWNMTKLYAKLAEWAHRDPKLRDALSDPYRSVQRATLNNRLPVMLDRIVDLLYNPNTYPHNDMSKYLDSHTRGLNTTMNTTMISVPNRDLQAPPTPYMRGADPLPHSQYVGRAIDTPRGPTISSSIFGDYPAVQETGATGAGSPERAHPETSRSLRGTSIIEHPDANINPSLLRFYAHLAIAMNEAVATGAIEFVSVEKVQNIISRYVDLLIQQGQHPGLGQYNDIAPLYIRRLDIVQQIEKLADLFEGAVDSKQLLLRHLKTSGELGLNIQMALGHLIVRMINKYRVEHNIPTMLDPDTATLTRFSLSSGTYTYVNSYTIDALLSVFDCFNPRVMFMWESLELANAALRSLLLTGQYQAAHTLAAAVSDNTELYFGEHKLWDEHENDVWAQEEFDQLHMFIQAHNAFIAWNTNQGDIPKAEIAANQLRAMLERPWGVFENDFELKTSSVGEGVPQSDWRLLRRRFVPFMIKALWQVNMSMKNYSDAIKYTARFASDLELGYYKESVCPKSELREFQRNIRDACLKSLESGRDCFGF